MTDERLSEIEERVNKATAGPWTALGDGDWQDVSGFAHDFGCGCCQREDGNFVAADAQFIAHARQDVPELIAEVRRLRAENAALLSIADRANELTDQAMTLMRGKCLRHAGHLT